VEYSNIHCIAGHWAVVAMVVLGVGGATGVLPAGERGWARGLVCVSAAGCATVYLCGAYLPARLLLAALLFAALAAQSLFAGFVNWPSARVAQALPYLYAAALALYAALLLAIPAAFASVPGLLGKGSPPISPLFSPSLFAPPPGGGVVARCVR
jgi:hypothetical protein